MPDMPRRPLNLLISGAGHRALAERAKEETGGNVSELARRLLKYGDGAHAGRMEVMDFGAFFQVPGHAPLRPCNNPLCNYLLAGGALYCCDPCSLAHERSYEIHADGPLGHDPRCARREAQR